MNSSEPSSLLSRNVYWPAVGTVRFAIACTTKFCVRPPNAASPDQSIVGLSTSMFGVCPVLIGQISLGARPSWNTRCVTPGSCGGGFCAPAIGAAAPSSATRPQSSASLLSIFELSPYEQSTRPER